jgi:hypothetical protein
MKDRPFKDKKKLKNGRTREIFLTKKRDLKRQLNFTVLDNELCVSLNEEEEIEIFSGKKDATSVKVVKDNVIDSDMRLCHIESQVCFANNTKLYKMSMRN